MGFDRHGFVRGRLAQVRDDLTWALDRFTLDDLQWAPSPGMRTVGGQFAEIIGTEQQILSSVKGEAAEDYKTIYEGLMSLGSLDLMRSRLDSVREETLAYLESLSAEGLEELMDIDPTWFEAGGQAQIPRHEALEAIANHEWYHTAQLISYLWFKGVSPYA